MHRTYLSRAELTAFGWLFKGAGVFTGAFVGASVNRSLSNDRCNLRRAQLSLSDPAVTYIKWRRRTASVLWSVA